MWNVPVREPSRTEAGRRRHPAHTRRVLLEAFSAVHRPSASISSTAPTPLKVRLENVMEKHMRYVVSTASLSYSGPMVVT